MLQFCTLNSLTIYSALAMNSNIESVLPSYSHTPNATIKSWAVALAVTCVTFLRIGISESKNFFASSNWPLLRRSATGAVVRLTLVPSNLSPVRVLKYILRAKLVYFSAWFLSCNFRYALAMSIYVMPS